MQWDLDVPTLLSVLASGAGIVWKLAEIVTQLRQLRDDLGEHRVELAEVRRHHDELAGRVARLEGGRAR